jgi:heptosyltransferase-2
MSVPALRRLRGSFRDAEITLLTRDWAEGIFRDADFIDRIVAVRSDASAVASVYEQASVTRKENFDAAIVLPNSFESALAARLSGAKRSIGYATDGRGFLLTDSVEVPAWKSERHEVFYYLNLIEAAERALLGTIRDEAEIDSGLPVSDERKNSAREFLSLNGVDLSRPTVAIAAGSKNSRAKRWGTDKFSELADVLASRANANVLLVGAPEEADVSEAVKSRSSAPIVDLTGRTNLADAAAILAVADLLVSNDMGLAHLAPAAGTPAIVIFGPTKDATTRPWGERSTVVRVDVECSPCMLRDCPIDHRCMTRISVESVYQKAEEYLRRT